LFRRSKTAEAPPSVALKDGGKGRATPTRKEAQAAAKARARGPADKKEAARLQRQRRGEASAKAREGLKRGDERYLPTRDKGPVRRFVRDFVDARLCIAEFLLPVLVLTLLLGALAPRVTGAISNAMLLLVVLDSALLIFRLRRELARRFPGQSTKGTGWYAVTRSIFLRRMRTPKTQVKLGARLPERY
jgi:hypothetical protein